MMEKGLNMLGVARLLLAKLVFTLLSVCVPSLLQAREESLNNTAWVLKFAQGGQIPSKKPELRFKNGDFFGNDGCNTISGSYQQKGVQRQRLILRLGMSTRMACPQEIQEFNQRYAYLLSQVTGFRREPDGMTLTLLDAPGRTILRYQAISQALERTQWTVSAVNDGQQAVESTSGMERLHISFTANGELFGFAGCNDFSAAYKYHAGKKKIEISNLTISNMVCTDKDIMRIERNFIKALVASSYYELTNSTLELRDHGGAHGSTQVALHR